jgi:hypothetical protein
MEYLKYKLNKLKSNSNNKNARHRHRDTTEFNEGYQTRTILIKAKRDNLLKDIHKILCKSRQKNYLSALEYTGNG